MKSMRKYITSSDMLLVNFYLVSVVIVYLFICSLVPMPLTRDLTEEREELATLPADDSETSEEIINGIKYTRQCKTQRRVSGSVTTVETVCKLVPYENGQRGQESQRVPVAPTRQEPEEWQPRQENQGASDESHELKRKHMDDDDNETIVVNH